MKASALFAVVHEPSGSDQPSPSVSVQPYLSRVEVPEFDGQLSPVVAGGGLSPYPSPSVSAHCVISPIYASAPLPTVHTEPLVPDGSGSLTLSPSSSGHPVLSTFEVPITAGHESAPLAIVHPPSGSE